MKHKSKYVKQQKIKLSRANRQIGNKLNYARKLTTLKKKCKSM